MLPEIVFSPGILTHKHTRGICCVSAGAGRQPGKNQRNRRYSPNPNTHPRVSLTGSNPIVSAAIALAVKSHSGEGAQTVARAVICAETEAIYSVVADKTCCKVSAMQGA
jgi:hypothetical protein